MTYFSQTLPSNASMGIYPNNTLTKYVTKLQNPISVRGEWEVALEEISLPRSWYTISKETGRFTVDRKGWPVDDELYIGEVIHRTYELEYGNYTNVQEIIQKINSEIRDDLSHRFFLMQSTNKAEAADMHVPITERDMPRFIQGNNYEKLTYFFPRRIRNHVF